MKKSKVSKVLFGLATVASLSVVALGTQGLFAGEAVVAYAAATTAEVSTIQEFQDALLNAEVTVINVNSSIEFTKNICNIPNRDVTINGNAAAGVVINSGKYSVYGKQNKNGKNTFAITNANIIGNDTCGHFFTGGSGNGPSSYGWDVYAEGVTYSGARFVHLSEGKLTFGGVNSINTRAENAWVHDLEFLAGSTYTGVAANKDHAQYAAFYFNGSLVNGKTTGEAVIGDNAKVDVKIGPQSTVNYYYPVFYDKVATVTVGNNAEFNVDAAGVAFQFIPRSNYVNGNPSLNIGENSRVNFNGRGGGNYATMKLKYYGTTVNVDQGASLVVTGNSKKAVIESCYKGAVINLNAVENFEVTNQYAGGKLYYATDTTINATDIYAVEAWNQTGSYSDTSDHYFDGGNFSINFGKTGNSKTLSVTGEISADFQLENYGKIKLAFGGF